MLEKPVAVVVSPGQRRGDRSVCLRDALHSPLPPTARGNNKVLTYVSRDTRKQTAGQQSLDERVHRRGGKDVSIFRKGTW